MLADVRDGLNWPKSPSALPSQADIQVTGEGARRSAVSSSGASRSKSARLHGVNGTALAFFSTNAKWPEAYQRLECSLTQSAISAIPPIPPRGNAAGKRHSKAGLEFVVADPVDGPGSMDQNRSPISRRPCSVLNVLHPLTISEAQGCRIEIILMCPSEISRSQHCGMIRRIQAS
jgi:hypothetical protein